MKYEWRKKNKELYLPKDKPTIFEVPLMQYFTLSGSGNPNSEEFHKAVEVLYALSYAIRMMPKKGMIPDGYFEYTVFPLEGVWDLDEEGRKLVKLDKERLLYKLMIRQPEFVTEDLLNKAKELISKKIAKDWLSSVLLEKIEEGSCVQCMHIGSYDDESTTFSKMEEFCQENGLKRIDKRHREIYINDPRKTSIEKLKTVLRFKVTH